MSLLQNRRHCDLLKLRLSSKGKRLRIRDCFSTKQRGNRDPMEHDLNRSDAQSYVARRHRIVPLKNQIRGSKFKYNG